MPFVKWSCLLGNRCDAFMQDGAPEDLQECWRLLSDRVLSGALSWINVNSARKSFPTFTKKAGITMRNRKKSGGF